MLEEGKEGGWADHHPIPPSVVNPQRQKIMLVHHSQSKLSS